MRRKKPYKRDFEKFLLEIESRDSIFRRDFNAQKRKQIMPWGMKGREAFSEEELEIGVQFITKAIDLETAINRITELMEKYYGKSFAMLSSEMPEALKIIFDQQKELDRKIEAERKAKGIVVIRRTK